ncbi:MAG: efflux RND transporter periplasmic adaptor subunit [Ignavibacteriae bacterium]|nr:efflux RND transporter periplasmic adaptor subunit [Ignavibacteria bacterium]MBI3364506.1 efflux RND transporter periplasmic adaptor subunit [Ignavibacteriota bacterium]
MATMKTALRKLFFFIILCFILVLTFGCGGNKAGGGGFSMPPMSVEVSPVTVQKVSDKFEGIGTIEAIEAITVVSEIDASVKAFPFKEGGFISRGGLIAQLDDAQLAAELARAEALRAQSQSSYDRVKSVVDQHAGAPQDLDDAAASLKVAEANLALAKARFDKTRIVAPFDGIIGARRVSVGTFLRAGQAITELANIDEIRVTFSAPERFLSKLSQGATVAVSTSAFLGDALNGTIIVIEPMIDQATRSARVVARVQNVGRKFRPGMSANVSAVLSERPNALTIPSEAVFGSGNQSFVFIVKTDSTVARVPLTLGTRMSDVVEVVEGLQPGMIVVRAGHQKLFDGGKVMPMSSQPAPSTQ